MNELNQYNECWNCKNKRTVSGDCHIRCADPDPDMAGNAVGIRRGWFIYPNRFDPTWKTKMCANFLSRGAK